MSGSASGRARPPISTLLRVLRRPSTSPSRTRNFSSPLMKFAVLVSAFLLPVVALAHEPSPLLARDGRDLSFLLKRYDGPVPILLRAVKGKRHTVPRTLLVEEVPVRRGLVERQQCVDPGYVPCPDGAQCCPADAVCGPGTCCPKGNLVCTGICKDRYSFLRLSLPLTHYSLFRLPRCFRCLLSERWVLPRWSGERVHSTNDLANFSFGVPQVCFTALNGEVGCCPVGQTCTTISGE